MPILPLTNSKITTLTQLKTKGCSFGIRGKIDIFLYGMGKVRENQTLKHLSENFLTLRRCLKNLESSEVSEVFPKIYNVDGLNFYLFLRGNFTYPPKLSRFLQTPP